MGRLRLLVAAVSVVGAVGVLTEARQGAHPIRFKPGGPSANWGMAFTETSKTHLYYESRDNGGSSAGIWEARPFTRHYRNFSYAQFIYVLEGKVTLEDSETGRSDTFKAGDAVLIARGATFTWRQTEKVREYFVIFDRETPASSRVPPTEKPTFRRLEPDGPPGIGLKASRGGSAQFHEYYQGAENSRVGTETTSAVTQQYRDTTFAKFIVFLSGRATFRVPDGSTVVVNPGEAVLLPRGMDCTWESQEVRTFYVVFDRGPEAGRRAPRVTPTHSGVPA